MARISGINIPLNKRAEIGLTYIYGIGRQTANKHRTQQRLAWASDRCEGQQRNRGRREQHERCNCLREARGEFQEGEHGA